MTTEPVPIAEADEQQQSDREQTLADSDQTLADADQTSADSDQADAESDQLAADQDQDASDRELTAGGSVRAHEASRDVRERTTLQREQTAERREQTAEQREQTAEQRLEVADQRDHVADTRDLAAFARDQAAAARDLAMAQLDAAHEHPAGARTITGTEIVLRAAEQRRAATRFRAQAAEHRTLAADDRQVATRDREQAARERRQALEDRKALALALATASTDELTGARTRAAGLTDLEHEIDRCRRASEPLVVVYVDLVGLKTINDTEGHAAGDELIKRAIALIRGQLRSYDLIVRVGGDEFVCAMSDMAMAEARRRFSQVTGALASMPQRGAIRTGFAELAPEETAAELIARADGQLLHDRDTPAIVLRHELELRNGLTVSTRPATLDDEPAIWEFLSGLSVDSRRLRFFSAGVDLRGEAHRGAARDDADHHGIVAFAPGRGVVGHATFVRAADSPRAEVAVEVADDLHQLGLATLLMIRLAQSAEDHQISHFFAAVLPENRDMLAVFRDGFATVSRNGPDAVEVEFPTSGWRAAHTRFESAR